MIQLKRTALTLAILVAFASKIDAQAIRFNTICYSRDFVSSFDEQNVTNPMSNWFAGLGYEQNIGDRIAISIDINSSLGKLFGEEDEQYRSFDYYEPGSQYLSSYEFSYSSYITYTELNYQSKFFFNTNDDGSGYISSGIGLKFVRWNLSPSTNYYTPPDEIASLLPSQNIEEKKLIIPVSLRLGHRGSLDGVFGEYFFGVSYNIGAGNFPEDSYLKNFYDKKPMRSLSFNIGYLWGIGWAD